jgi:hypothetical protein
LQSYLRVVHKAHQLGFKIVAYQILGLPSESLDSMIQTLAFNARLPVLLGASPFYRTPASPIAGGLDLHEGDFVRARLTALAIETEGFKREDIYTLFITTRIINFLKGLPITSSKNLKAVIYPECPDNRTAIGVELLRLLETTNQLYFWTSKGLCTNQNFRTEIFWRVLSQAGEIGCQNGQRLSVGEILSLAGTGARRVRDRRNNLEYLNF